MSATPISEEAVYRKAEIVNSDFELLMILGHDTVSYINSYTSWRRYLWFLDILSSFIWQNGRQNRHGQIVCLFEINKVWIIENGTGSKTGSLKKSAIFTLSLWYLVKITSSGISYFGWISAWLDKNCGFFTYTKFLSQSYFLLSVLYNT